MLRSFTWDVRRTTKQQTRRLTEQNQIVAWLAWLAVETRLTLEDRYLQCVNTILAGIIPH